MFLHPQYQLFKFQIQATGSGVDVGGFEYE